MLTIHRGNLLPAWILMALMRAGAEAARPHAGSVGYAELPYAHHVFDLLPSARTRATEYAIGQFLDVTRDRAKNPVPPVASVEQDH